MVSSMECDVEPAQRAALRECIKLPNLALPDLLRSPAQQLNIPYSHAYWALHLITPYRTP